MSSLFGMMYKGVSGVNVSQISLDVVGQNIANIKNPNYSRQVATLATTKPEYTYVGAIGTGVKVTSITRCYDELLQKSVRTEGSSYTYFNSMSSYMKSAMLYFNELQAGSGLGDALKGYFDAWSSLSNSATDNSDDSLIKRRVLIEKTQTLSSKIREGYSSIQEVQNTANTTIKDSVAEINQILENIASMNKEIARAESTNISANDARDARDALLNRLSELSNISVSNNPNGQATVMLGSQMVVDGSTYYSIEAIANKDNGGFYDLYWTPPTALSDKIVMSNQITGGTLGAAFKTRDVALKGYLDQLDTLAKSLITSTNSLHSSGQGLERFTNITGTNGVTNPTYPLSNVAGKFELPVQSGSFRMTVYNENGEAVNIYDINIDPKVDNMLAIVQRINSSNGDFTGSLAAAGEGQPTISAFLTDNNSIEFAVPKGYTFAFSNDTSNFLVAAGLNTFFSGTSAKDIDLSELVASNPRYIAAAQSGAPGDNTNATAIANLQYTKLGSAGGVTIGSFYGVFAGQMGADKNQVDVYAATKKMAFNQLNTQQESIKGVSESEELVDLSLYQRMFEANSRFINTVDEMLNMLINGMGSVGR